MHRPPNISDLRVPLLIGGAHDDRPRTAARGRPVGNMSVMEASLSVRRVPLHQVVPRACWIYLACLAGPLAWLTLGVTVRDLGGFSSADGTGLTSPQFFWIGLPMGLVMLWMAVTFVVSVTLLLASFLYSPPPPSPPGRRRGT